MKKNKMSFEEGSGNVYADLGLPRPEVRLIKATLAIEIERIVYEKKLSQKEAAIIFGVSQPRISEIRRGRLEHFTIDRLVNFLILLDQNVSITIGIKNKGR